MTIQRLFGKTLEVGSQKGSPFAASGFGLYMDESHLKAVKRRSVFLRGSHSQADSHASITSGGVFGRSRRGR